MKRALFVMVMAKEGRSTSAQEVAQAEQITGHSMAQMREGTAHINPYAAKTYDDDEDISDTA